MLFELLRRRSAKGDPMKKIVSGMTGRGVAPGLVVALAAAVAAMSAVTPASVAAPRVGRSAHLVPSRLKVFAGYADSYHVRTGSGHPATWQRSRGVIFKGCNYFTPSRCPSGVNRPHRYDAGAIRLDNRTSHAITVTKARVVIGSCTFRPWPGLHVRVGAGKKLILTETGGTPGKAPCHTTDSRDNFDTSETHFNPNTKCTKNDGKIPVFHVTVNRMALTYRDTGQILNTGGKDPGAKGCGFLNEMHRWGPMTRLPSG
jgi:hypothetical protein